MLSNFGFGYLCNVRIRSAGEIMNYFDFYSMQADSLRACVPISVLNSFLTKMLVRLVGPVTIDIVWSPSCTMWLSWLQYPSNSKSCTGQLICRAPSAYVRNWEEGMFSRYNKLWTELGTWKLVKDVIRK